MKRLRFALKCFFVAMKGGEDMKFALTLAYTIMEGIFTWDDIADPWKPAVKYWLDAYGVGTDGKPIMPPNITPAQ